MYKQLYENYRAKVTGNTAHLVHSLMTEDWKVAMEYYLHEIIGNDLHEAMDFKILKKISDDERFRDFHIIAIDRFEPKEWVKTIKIHEQKPEFIKKTKIWFDNKNYSAEKSIILEFNLAEPFGHFNLIKRINKYYGYRHFCLKCWEGNNQSKPHSHKCPDQCMSCNKKAKCAGPETSCLQCNITCFGEPCLTRHVSNNVCKSRKKCLTCLVTLRCCSKVRTQV